MYILSVLKNLRKVMYHSTKIQDVFFPNIFRFEHCVHYHHASFSQNLLVRGFHNTLQVFCLDFSLTCTHAYRRTRTTKAVVLLRLVDVQEDLDNSKERRNHPQLLLLYVTYFCVLVTTYALRRCSEQIIDDHQTMSTCDFNFIEKC